MAARIRWTLIAVLLTCSVMAAACRPISQSASGLPDGSIDVGGGAMDTREWEAAPEAPPFVPSNAAERAAQRLTRFVWDEDRPPADILAAVANGEAERVIPEMVTDARVAGGVRAFVRHWLKVDELASIRKPEGVLSTELRSSMRDEPGLLVAHTFSLGDRKLASVLTADYTFMDSVLARHYGSTEAGTDAPVKSPFPTADRLGLFGTASVLTLASGATQPAWPTRRFAFVAEKLLCREAGAGPFSTIGFPVDQAIGMRRQLTERTAMADCMVCHRYVNPMGFAFLRFDTVGRLQAQDPDGPIDPAGQIPSTAPPASFPFPADLLGKQFQDQPSLMRHLAGSPSVRACFARQWLAFAFERDFRAPGPAGQVEAAVSAFEASGGDMRDLMVHVARQLKEFQP